MKIVINPKIKLFQKFAYNCSLNPKINLSNPKQQKYNTNLSENEMDGRSTSITYI